MTWPWDTPGTHTENPELTLPSLFFTGNIVLLGETETAATENYDNLQNKASCVGLKSIRRERSWT